VTIRVSKEGTESGIRRGRGTREAVTTKVKVAGISTSNVTVDELVSGRAVVAGVADQRRGRRRRDGVRQEQQGQ
jgi:hypothetical protein